MANDETEELIHKKAIPEDVDKAIHSVFMDLADPNLPERCLLGATQNRNEALHHTLWILCSKAELQSKATIELSSCCNMAEQ